ncbi:hypothetical protein [Mesorhizobium sp. KR2-14]|uniref:hypothetical protein n=1 Tax=Mesorhizobium sp. KR2-14 TaxID=3156610 RepID=UPI0032B53E52
MIIFGSGRREKIAQGSTAIRFEKVVPERKVLCGIQSIMKPLREKTCASPASLEIMMKVFMHMTSI